MSTDAGKESDSEPQKGSKESPDANIDEKVQKYLAKWSDRRFIDQREKNPQNRP
ncbi:hypothetical protein V5P93_000279 [Actinokineospora auranticolor]|uniref:hypothetical protein n=1 Tax=Actinokineospora auranticolor TaxID=155976 RepID=UPI0015E4110C|nr:hypothetical protein [Actinokineospora auranticolor]